MGTVFVFLHQPSDESSATSGNTIRSIIELLPQIKNMPEEQKQQIIEKLQPIARKLAHLSIYATGGILISLLLNEYSLSDSKKIIFSGALGCIYSITDEIHQIFIPRKSWNVN